MRIILALMILFFIEIILETGFRINSTLGAGISVKNLLLYSLLLAAVFKWHNEPAIYRDKKFGRVLLLFTAFVVYCAFTLSIPVLFSVPGYDLRQGLSSFKGELFDPFLCFIIFWVFTKRYLANPGLIAKLLLIVVAAFCLLMIAERLVPSIEMFGVDDSSELRLNGPFGEPNQTAAVLSLCLPLALSLVFTSGRMRIFYAAIAVCMAMCIVITGSRGGILGAGIGCLYLLWTIRHQLALSNKLLMIVTVPMLAILAWVILPETSRELILFRFSFLNESNIDWEDASAGRVYLWRLGLQLWQSSPIFGQGWSSYQMIAGNASHSIYLDYLVSLGIVGLGIVAAFYWRLILFFSTGKNVNADRNFALLINGSRAGVIALLVSLAFVNLYKPWILVWCILGALAGYSSALKTIGLIGRIKSQAR